LIASKEQAGIELAEASVDPIHRPNPETEGPMSDSAAIVRLQPLGVGEATTLGSSTA